MTATHKIRTARLEDLDELLAIEVACFRTDRLSKRSFRNFILPGPHELIVLTRDERVL
ncbi:MAG: ribosomal-protein-alanine acetyltransferase, partial [Gammaproteobacteria bacterium]|nr:ribosomal-protein-alanine acetyltransferase [Gammaproteobacteria bacterium]